jgi:hypothetical protein
MYSLFVLMAKGGNRKRGVQVILRAWLELAFGPENGYLQAKEQNPNTL